MGLRFAYPPYENWTMQNQLKRENADFGLTLRGRILRAKPPGRDDR
jgi:hypothetical protein